MNNLDPTKCERCQQHAKTKESRFLGGNFCYSCYLLVMEKLLACRKARDDQ